MMLPLDRHFVKGQWERHYIDLPGSGSSTRLEAMTSEAVVDAVSRYIDASLAERDFALVGVSYGGFIARALHARYGGRVLGSTLIAPAVKAAGRRQISVGHQVVEFDGFESELDESDSVVLSSFKSISPRHTRTSWTAYVEHVVPGYQAHDREAAAELLENYNLEPFPESALTEPLDGTNLLIAGKQDSVVGWRDQLELLDFYNHLSYAALDGAGHNVHLDQPAVVGSLFEDWLSKLQNSRSIPLSPLSVG